MKKAKFLNFFASLALLLNMSYLGVFFDSSEAQAVIARQNLCTTDVDVVLVMDRSYSMYFGGLPNKLTAAKTAANNFLGLLGSADQSALVSFADGAVLDKGLSNNHTGNPSSTGNAVNSLVALGNTNVGDAIGLANGELASVRADVNAVKVEILLTDGIANRPTSVPSPEAYAQTKAVEAAAVGIRIFTIGLGSDVNQTALQSIANVTGGSYYFAPEQSDLQNIYNLISQKLCDYGSISGCKYADIDNDGSTTDGDSKIAGWNIGLSGAKIASTITDDNGCYTFSGLVPGKYTVNEGEKDGVAFYQKTHENYPNGIDIDWGSQINNADFYNYIPVCGNKILDNYEEYSEECEIGSSEKCIYGDYVGTKSCTDACNWGKCVPNEFCGDNLINGEEQCDGDNMGKYDDGHYICRECSAIYQPYCGDKLVNQPTEECDGSEPVICETETGYAGTRTCGECVWGNCQTNESCGDGIQNGNEICDNGQDNGKYGSCNSDCTGQTPSVCGNKVVEGEEECDGGENCTEGCTLIKDEPRCGDKKCGSNENCETCPADCGECGNGDTLRCGDGIKNQPSEECDGSDGLTAGYSCLSTCLLQKENSGGGNSSGIFFYNNPQFPIVSENQANEVEEVKVLGESGAPELAITKAVNKAFANPGDEDIEYIVKVVNNGKLSAFNTILKDKLPAGLVYQDDGKSEREWLIGDLATGDVKEFKYKVKVAKTAEAKKYENIATVKADNHAEVSASATIEVRKIVVLAETGFSIYEFLALLASLAFFSLMIVLIRKKQATME